MFKKTMIAIFAVTGLSACSHAPTEIDKVVSNNVGKERILGRIDGLDSRPSWLKESDPLVISGGKVYSIGQTTINSTDSLSAAYRIAESNGKSGLSHAISQRLSFVFQDAQDGVEMTSNQSRYIGAAASELTTSALKVTKRYWEKVATVQDNSQVTVQYRVFALVEMEEPQFKGAILDAIRRANGKQGLSADFAKKVSEHWDKFVQGDKVTPEARNPSNTANQE